MEDKQSLCLRDLPLFAGVAPGLFRPVCAGADKRSLRRGDVLFHQGDPVDAIHLVKLGSFKLVRVTEDGREVILRIVGEGEVIGEDALFQERSHPATSIALQDAKVCSISRQRLEEAIKQNPDLAWQVIASLGSRLYALWTQMEELNVLKTRERVLSLLVRLSKEHGEDSPQGTRLRLHLTQEEIAGLVGASRVMVSHVLKDLEADNRVCREGKHYILRDNCSLVRSAAS